MHRLANILLVEDNDADIALTRAIFEHEGVVLNLHTVQDGKQAMDFLRRHPPYDSAPQPDLILMDMTLPGADGAAVVEQIRQYEAWARIPILVVSGLDENAPQTGRLTGVDGHLGKPVHYQRLRAAVATLPGLTFESGDGGHCLYRLTDD